MQQRRTNTHAPSLSSWINNAHRISSARSCTATPDLHARLALNPSSSFTCTRGVIPPTPNPPAKPCAPVCIGRRPCLSRPLHRFSPARSSLLQAQASSLVSQPPDLSLGPANSLGSRTGFKASRTLGPPPGSGRFLPTCLSLAPTRRSTTQPWIRAPAPTPPPPPTLLPPRVKPTLPTLPTRVQMRHPNTTRRVPASSRPVASRQTRSADFAATRTTPCTS